MKGIKWVKEPIECVSCGADAYQTEPYEGALIDNDHSGMLLVKIHCPVCEYNYAVDVTEKVS